MARREVDETMACAVEPLIFLGRSFCNLGSMWIAVDDNIQQDHGVAVKGQRTKFGVGEVLMVYDHLLDQFNHHRVIHGGEITDPS